MSYSRFLLLLKRVMMYSCNIFTMIVAVRLSPVHSGQPATTHQEDIPGHCLHPGVIPCSLGGEQLVPNTVPPRHGMQAFMTAW